MPGPLPDDLRRPYFGEALKRCASCDVQGRMRACWMCGTNDLTWPVSSPAYPGVTLDELTEAVRRGE